MKNFIITSITSSLLGTLITLCFITYYKPYPKIGRVYQQINTNPFDTHIV